MRGDTLGSVSPTATHLVAARRKRSLKSVVRCSLMMSAFASGVRVRAK